MSPAELRRQLVGKPARRPRKEHDGYTKDELWAELLDANKRISRAASIASTLGRDLRRARMFDLSDSAYSARDILHGDKPINEESDT